VPQTKPNNISTIVIADDHPLFMEGLKNLIAKDQSLFLIGEASSGNEALALIRKEKPQMAVLDIELPELSGIEIAREIQKEKLNCKVIFLTMYNDKEILDEAIRLGVKGYILKEHTSAEILNCIKTVLAERFYISPLLSHHLINDASVKGVSAIESSLSKLTISEKRILKLIALNKTSREIAGELHISPKTVENHRKNICEKLQLRGSNSLLKFAIENKASLERQQV
jgi:DNA-binding NarL/FixJ family response regulator